MRVKHQISLKNVSARPDKGTGNYTVASVGSSDEEDSKRADEEPHGARGESTVDDRLMAESVRGLGLNDGPLQACIGVGGSNQPSEGRRSRYSWDKGYGTLASDTAWTEDAFAACTGASSAAEQQNLDVMDDESARRVSAMLQHYDERRMKAQSERTVMEGVLQRVSAEGQWGPVTGKRRVDKGYEGRGGYYRVDFRDRQGRDGGYGRYGGERQSQGRRYKGGVLLSRW